MGTVNVLGCFNGNPVNGLEFALGTARIQLNNTSDDFSDGVRGWQWNQTGTPSGNDVITETGNALHIESYNNLLGYESSVTYTGDINYTVGFSGMTFGGAGAPNIRTMLTFDANNYAHLLIQQSGATRTFDFRTVIGGVAQSSQPSAAGVTSGTWQIQRKGNVIILLLDGVVVHTRTGAFTGACTIRHFAVQSSSSMIADFTDFVVEADCTTNGGRYITTSPVHGYENLDIGSKQSVTYEQIKIPTETLTSASDEVEIRFRYGDDGVSWSDYTSWVALDYFAPTNGTVYYPTAISTTNGTVITGDYTDLAAIDGVYYQVQETGQFAIEITFGGVATNAENLLQFYGKYVGNTAHEVEWQVYNQVLLQWDDLIATTKDFPSAATDYTVDCEIPGTVSDYYTGAGPYTLLVRIIHTSAANPNHNMYIDMMRLGSSALDLCYPPMAEIGGPWEFQWIDLELRLNSSGTDKQEAGRLIMKDVIIPSASGFDLGRLINSTGGGK